MGEQIDGWEVLGRLAERIEAMWADMAPDLKMVGQAGAEAIVRTTLAGIGEDDQGFTPYSKAYQEVVDAVGGKPQGGVNLRGLFYHGGQKRKRYRSEAARLREREGRQAFVSVTFGTRGLMLGGQGLLSSFTARTGVTRPARGVTDPLSEMSLDLIRVDATHDSISLRYVPRSKPYMIRHHNGDSKMPRRPWFTLKRAACVAGMHKVLRLVVRARIARAEGETAAAVVDAGGSTVA